MTRSDRTKGQHSGGTHLTRVGKRSSPTSTVRTVTYAGVPICSRRRSQPTKLDRFTGASRERHQPGFRWSGRVTGCGRDASQPPPGVHLETYPQSARDALSCNTYSRLQMRIEGRGKRCSVVPKNSQTRHPGSRPGIFSREAPPYSERS